MLTIPRPRPPVFILGPVALLLGLGVAATPAAQAQDASDADSIPLSEEAWALQFDVRPNFFALSSFLGSTISAKRHTYAARARQVGLTLGASVVSRKRQIASICRQAAPAPGCRSTSEKRGREAGATDSGHRAFRAAED